MRRSLQGFTLIEMLGVIAIMLILAALIVGIGKYAKEKGRRSKVESQLAKIVQGSQRCMGDRGFFPGGLDANYHDTVPQSVTDPWGVRLLYRTFNDNREFVVGSLGPDMKPGFANVDDDRPDMQHPWRSNGVDITIWTEFGYGDDIVAGDCTMKKRFPP